MNKLLSLPKGEGAGSQARSEKRLVHSAHQPSLMEGVGRIYHQAFIDTYAKVAFAKLYDRKTPITAADLLDDRVLPFFEHHEIKLLRVLSRATPSVLSQSTRLPSPLF